jgi:predicted 3-demethylubiquinone-9 3-methyltransferase (glyoxalase superfamily)
MPQKITPYLWFDNDAEEAVNLYTSLFENSKITHISRYPDGGRGELGKVMIINFELDGQEFIALNGGPDHPFSDAMSLYVNCTSQEEVDKFWNGLTANGGEEGPCGWLKDKFGISWQIIPTRLGELMGDPNPAKVQSVMQAMLQMKKIEIADLQQAYDKA